VLKKHIYHYQHTEIDAFIVRRSCYILKFDRSINSKEGKYWIVPLLHSVRDVS